MHVAIKPLYTGEPCLGDQLVGIGGIDHERGAASFFGKPVGQLGTQLSGMLYAVGAAIGVIQQMLAI